MEFIVPTYGSYNDLVYAVGVITRIIRSDEFNSLLKIMFFMAVLIGVTSAVLSSFFKGGKVTYHFGISIVLGVIFVFMFIKPGATVVIEDKYYGKSGTAGYFQAIKDVPWGAAMMIWFYSYIQEITTNMIDNYGAPVLTIGDGGMDVSYSLITNMDGMMGVAQTAAPQFVANVQNYVRDCVLPGVATDQILIENLTMPGATANLWDQMRLNATAIFTEYNGMILGCPQAHSSITAAFKATEVVKIRDAYCIENNIAMINGKVDSQTCGDKIGKLTEAFFHKSAPDYMMTYIAAATTQNVAESYLDLADKQTYIANATAAVQAEKWLPKLRSNTFVVVVLLAPIVFLLVFFAPGASIKWYGGMYIWLIFWGMADQLMFVMYQMELYDVFSNMRASGLGFLQVLDVKAEMLETMGLYGKMRWASMTLSLALCTGILKIGNNSMVGMAENMGASAQQTAGQAASALSGIGGTDAAREQMIRQQTRGWAAAVTPEEAIANQELLQHFQGTQNAAAMTNAFGGAYQAAYAGGQNQAHNALMSTANREAMLDKYGNKVYDEAAKNAVFGMEQQGTNRGLLEEKATQAGFTHEEMMKFEATGGVVNKDNMDEVAKLYGIDQSLLREGMAMSGTWTGKGFDNIVATEAGFASDGMAGRMTTSFGDDGKMSMAEFSGTMNGTKAQITWDENGKVHESTVKGYNHSYEAVNSSRIANIRTVEDIDKTIYDHRNQHSTGSDTTAGDKVVVDNSNTFNSGTNQGLGDVNLWNAAQGGNRINYFAGEGINDMDSQATQQVASTISSFYQSSAGDGVSAEAHAGFGASLMGIFNFGASVSANMSASDTANIISLGMQKKQKELASDLSLTDDQRNAAMQELVQQINKEAENAGFPKFPEEQPKLANAQNIAEAQERLR